MTSPRPITREGDGSGTSPVEPDSFRMWIVRPEGLGDALAAFFQGDVFQVHGANVLCEGADQNVVGVLLHALKRPTGDAAHGEYRHEQVVRDAQQISRWSRRRSPR